MAFSWHFLAEIKIDLNVRWYLIGWLFQLFIKPYQALQDWNKSFAIPRTTAENQKKYIKKYQETATKNIGHLQLPDSQHHKNFSKNHHRTLSQVDSVGSPHGRVASGVTQNGEQARHHNLCGYKAMNGNFQNLWVLHVFHRIPNPQKHIKDSPEAMVWWFTHVWDPALRGWYEGGDWDHSDW